MQRKIEEELQRKEKYNEKGDHSFLEDLFQSCSLNKIDTVEIDSFEDEESKTVMTDVPKKFCFIIVIHS